MPPGALQCSGNKATARGLFPQDMSERAKIMMKSSDVQQFQPATLILPWTISCLELKHHAFVKNCKEKWAVIPSCLIYFIFKANISCITESTWISGFILVSRINIALYWHSFKLWIMVSLNIIMVLKRKILHINPETARMILIDFNLILVAVCLFAFREVRNNKVGLSRALLGLLQ